MSRRSNRRRRAARRERDLADLLAPSSVPFDPVRARSHMDQVLRGLRFRGSATRPFEHVVLGPVVQLDPDDPTPIPEQLDAKTDEAFIAAAVKQAPS